MVFILKYIWLSLSGTILNAILLKSVKRQILVDEVFNSKKKEGLTISEWVDTNLTHSERLFVESALRIKMEKMGLSLVGNDHFICDESQWRKILKEFPNLVNEMISLIEKI